MTIRNRVEKLETKASPGSPPFQVVLLGSDDPEPVGVPERFDCRGNPLITIIRLVGVRAR